MSACATAGLVDTPVPSRPLSTSDIAEHRSDLKSCTQHRRDETSEHRTARSMHTRYAYWVMLQARNRAQGHRNKGRKTMSALSHYDTKSEIAPCAVSTAICKPRIRCVFRGGLHRTAPAAAFGTGCTRSSPPPQGRPARGTRTPQLQNCTHAHKTLYCK